MSLLGRVWREGKMMYVTRRMTLAITARHVKTSVVTNGPIFNCHDYGW